VSERPLIVLATSELMLQSRLRESLQQLGYDVVIGDTSEALAKALGDSPEALILDLQSAVRPLDVIDRALRAAVPVLAYGQHTKANILRQAREAGAVIAVPRSEIVDDLAGLLARLSR
jgi:DNA-binding response OmpR family regulator